MTYSPRGCAAIKPAGRGAFAAGLALFLCLSLPALPAAGQGAGTDRPEGTASPAGANDTSAAMRLYLPSMTTHPWPVATPFGAQMYGWLHERYLGLSSAEAAHVSWVRSPVWWAAVEPTNTRPGSYQWAEIDRSMQTSLLGGVHLVATIISNPAWAATNPGGPVDKVPLSELAEFAGALARRYRNVEYWELYNEPDNGNPLWSTFLGGYWGHSGAEYARMLCAVYPAIKAASPAAQVALGGLAYERFEENGGPFVRTFLDDVLAAGGGQCFDVMNFHYYPVFNWVYAGQTGMAAKAEFLRDKLRSHGLTKPVIVTEVGWTSNGSGNSPQTQARWVPRLLVQGLQAQQNVVIWYSWKDSPRDDSFFGLVTVDLQSKPSLSAFSTAAQQIGFAHYQRALVTGEVGNYGDVEGHLLAAASGSPLYLLWTTGETMRTISLPVSRAAVTNLYGTQTTTVSDGDDGSSDGRIRVAVGPDAVYVEAIQ